jgi:hypothetical protein
LRAVGREVRLIELCRRGRDTNCGESFEFIETSAEEAFC